MLIRIKVLKMRKIVRFVSSIVLSIGLLGVVGQVAAADGGSSAPQFGSAEVAPTNPTIKKGNKIIVIAKDRSPKHFSFRLDWCSCFILGLDSSIVDLIVVRPSKS